MALPTINLEYDAPVAISTAGSRFSLKWVQQEILWSEFLARLSVPLRTQETMAAYQRMAKKRRDEIKDVGGFVGGRLRGGRRQADAVESRSLITLDLDSIPADTTADSVWSIIARGYDCAGAIYSTHSSTPQAERLRVVIPMKREVTPDEYGAISRKFASFIGIDFCDDTTYEPSRLMYWASCPVDADYVFRYNDSNFLDPDEILAEYDDWTDVTSWPVSSRQSSLTKHAASKQGDPTEKPGVIGAFCRVYDIPAVIDKYLPGVYTRGTSDDRWTYAAGSTTGGLVLYEDGKFAYSHHGTDPISGKLVNSFDMVRLHRFGDLDEDEPENTVVTKLPSYKRMIDLAVNDEEVAYQLAMDRVEGAFDEDSAEEADTDWLRGLEMTGKGGIANTITNVSLILLNDPRLREGYYYDAFRERPMVAGDLPWQPLAERISQVWNDTDDAGLRRFLEHEYKIESAAKIRDAVELAMLSRIRHPVREYLEGLVWDGEERLDSLFIRILGAEDDEHGYTREVTRKSLVGAVARILEPGCKHDHMLVLVGPQGCRKSTTLAKLGKEWYSDSLFTMAGKEAFEQIQGYWIIELGEMAATKKSEIEQIKSFISKKADNYRSAYARRTQDHPRQCAFFGSTNDEEFLRDATGGRRFWPVVVDNTGRRMIDTLTEEVVDQVWAEAVAAYKAGENWYLSEEAEAYAKKIQERHTEEPVIAGQIRDFLEKQIPTDWYERSLEERRWFLSEGPDEDDILIDRERICALEIWCECLSENPSKITQQKTREINQVLAKCEGWKRAGRMRFGAEYGQQRGFVRCDR